MTGDVPDTSALVVTAVQTLRVRPVLFQCVMCCHVM